MADALDIPLPAGYAQAKPFDRQKHRGLGVAKKATAFAHQLHAIYLTTLEIPRAGLDYPVAFVRDGADQIVPVALVGVEPKKNLFCDADGQWANDFYVPAYVRRYPFFLARIRNHEDRGLICVDETALSPTAKALIDSNGEPTAAWTERLQLIEQLDIEGKKTGDFCAKLHTLGILETFDADFHPSMERANQRAIPPVRINGLLRVSRKALGELDDTSLCDLVRQGGMQMIEAHLNSLARFDRLLNRYAVAATRND